MRTFHVCTFPQWVCSLSLPGSTPLCSLGYAPDNWANRTITHPLVVTSCKPGASPKWHTTQAGHLGLYRVSPWNDVKAVRTYRGQTGVDPGKLIKRTLWWRPMQGRFNWLIVTHGEVFFFQCLCVTMVTIWNDEKMFLCRWFMIVENGHFTILEGFEKWW